MYTPTPATECTMLAWVPNVDSSSWLWQDQKTRSPKSPAKRFLFLASSVVTMAEHDLKRRLGICGADDAAETAFCFVPAVADKRTALHLAPLNKMEPLTGSTFVPLGAKVAPG